MPDKTPDTHRTPDSSTPAEADIMRLRIGATFGLGLAALAVLALAGGSLNVTSVGVTMNVNPRP